MKKMQGGTQKWCPNCKAIQVCAARNPSALGYKAGQRWYRTQHADIQWFRRGLVCQSCGHQWLTAEVPEVFLDELVQLRTALADLRMNADAYSKESEKASKALRKLSGSLRVLKALES